jgi:hypothetical protein
MSFWAVLMFGCAYSILAGTVLLVLWKRSWKAHVLAALVAPVLMIPVVGVSMWVRGGTDALAVALDFAPTVSDWDTPTLQQLSSECGCSLG